MHPVDVTDDLLEDAADVLRADECRLCGGQRLAPPALELRTSSHRILELGAVRLDAERRTGRLADRSSEQHVVDEDEVGREPAQHLCVRCDVCGALAGRQVLQESWLEAGVTIHHEHGQQPTWKLGDDHARAAEVVLLRRALLADDRHLVTGPAPLAGERARVDVRAGPTEQVAVPERDAHWLVPYVRWK